jgi:hypothetical protein
MWFSASGTFDEALSSADQLLVVPVRQGRPDTFFRGEHPSPFPPRRCRRHL